MNLLKLNLIKIESSHTIPLNSKPYNSLSDENCCVCVLSNRQKLSYTDFVYYANMASFHASFLKSEFFTSLTNQKRLTVPISTN